MVKIKIDGKEFEAKQGEYVIDIALRNGIKIPHYCFHPALSRPANCRICLVEVEKAPKPMPSCILQVQEGLTVYTNSPKAKEARQAVMEYILLNHPIDCPICDKSGECLLQDFYFEYNANLRRAPKERVRKSKVVDIGPTIILDSERCILCTRCIRFMDEVAKTPCLGIIEKGAHSELTIYDNQKLDSVYSLNTVDLCPVGALTSKDFRFKQRVWFLSKSNSICNLCATGCNTTIEHKNSRIYRIVPRYNEKINGYFMCDYGRLTYKKILENTLNYSVINNKTTTNKLEASQFLSNAVKSKKILFIAGQNNTCEELLAIYTLIEKNPSDYFIYYRITDIGFLDSGFFDTYLVDKDKNPNTNGLKIIISKIPQQNILKEEAILSGEFDRVLILDEFFYLRFKQTPTSQTDEESFNFLRDFIRRFHDTIIYFSSHKSELVGKLSNTICIPNIYAKSGSFVNRNNILQHFEKVYRNDNAIDLLEILSLIFAQQLNPEYLWNKAKTEFPQFKNVEFPQLVKGACYSV